MESEGRKAESPADGYLFGKGALYGDHSLYIAVYIDCRCNMLFYHYIVLFETAGIESEVYAALAVGRGSDGASCGLSQASCVWHSSVWHRGQHEWPFYHVYCLYRDDPDGADIHCFPVGQKGQKAGAGNGGHG